MFFADRVPPEARDAYSKDAISGILVSVMSAITVPFFVVIARHRLHASDLEVVFLTMAPVAGNLFSLAWANMMQGRRKMPYATWSWVLARSLFFLVLFATCSKFFVTIVVLFWLIGSFASPAYSDLMKEVYPDSDRAKIMAYVRVCSTAVAVILLPIAGKLLEVVSYRYVFPVAAVFGVMSALVFNQVHAKETTGERGIGLFSFLWDSVRLLFHDKAYLWFCVAIFIFGFANFTAAPIYSIYEVDVLRAYEARQGIYALVATIVAALGYFYWGAWVDRRRPEKVIAWQTLAWAFIPLSYVFATRWWMLMPAKVLAGFVGAGTDLVYCTGVIYFAPQNRVTQYYAVFLTLMGIRGIAGPLLGGALVKWHVLSMHGVFGWSAAFIFLSVFVQIYGYRKYRSLNDPKHQQGDCTI